MTGWAIVTGASSGIGRAIVEGFLEIGQPVVSVARRGERLDDLVARYGTELLRVEKVDVRDRTQVTDLVAELGADGIDVLVNNAGLSLGLGPMEEGLPEDWRVMVDTNIEGVLNCTRAVLPLMRTAVGGHIINIGSIAAQYPYFGGNVYGASKAFVHHLSANMRTELDGTGIRVTCVAPGMVRSEFALVRFKGDESRAAALYDGIRPLSPGDVADAVLWAWRTPAHINVNYVELMSVDQPFGLTLSRATKGKSVT
ncbi:SDR family NAD(P)-dependent oxidoreductase [Micromonosporaceae bacterium Da 78-11]